MPRIGLFVLALCAVAACEGATPIIDNQRVTVWDLKDSADSLPRHEHDFVTVYLKAGTGGQHKVGDVVYSRAGVSHLDSGDRTVVIELKDFKVAPLVNKTSYPLAFPRPHVKKLLENDRVIVWSYAWHPGEPTPMHFHDKDVVVVYMEPTALTSTTPDGKATLNEYMQFQTKFNLRDRIHTELLVRGTGSAIMTELK